MSTNLIFILFELFVFALFCILIRDLSRQYVLPFIQEQILLLKKHLDDLRKKYSLTLDTKKNIEKKISEQQNEFQDLEQKVKAWHNSLEHEQEKMRERQHEVCERLLKKRSEQLASVMSIKLRQSVIPNAIELTRKKLSEEYKGDAGRVILVRLLEQLETPQRGKS